LKYIRQAHKEETKDRAFVQKTLHKTYEGAQRQFDNLTQLRLKEMIDDEEYLSQRNRLLKERARLKERMEDSEHQAGRWLELSERAFTFACYASYWFEHEGLEEKNTILRTIGSNFTLKDRKLSIEVKKP